MALEIERKFLLLNDKWRDDVVRSERFMQGYLATDDLRAIRVRVAGDKAHINIKHSDDGISRLEYEYPVPLDDAEEMLNKVALPTAIDKVRHYVPAGENLMWEIDEFFGANANLVVAEIELESVDQDYPKPEWLGEEVSQDARYYNSNLSKKPFNTW